MCFTNRRYHLFLNGSQRTVGAVSTHPCDRGKCSIVHAPLVGSKKTVCAHVKNHNTQVAVVLPSCLISN